MKCANKYGKLCLRSNKSIKLIFKRSFCSCRVLKNMLNAYLCKHRRTLFAVYYLSISIHALRHFNSVICTVTITEANHIQLNAVKIVTTVHFSWIKRI